MTTKPAMKQAAVDLAAMGPKIRRLALAVGRIVESESGLTPVQAGALSVIGHGAGRVHEVADQTQQHQSGASRVVDALVDAGFVSRRVDPDDRRATILELTSAGTRKLGQVTAAEIAVTESILDEVDKASARAIVDVLNEYLDAADKVIKRGS